MKRLLLTMMVLLMIGRSSAMASPVFLSAERFGYDGNWSRYASLVDAMANVNVTETGLMPQRDLSIYVSQGITDNPFDPEFDILTNWYSGSGNPSNTNYGFFQYYDADASTVTSLDGYWNSDLTEFTLQATAAGADYSSDFARFGERTGGSGAATEAYFHELEVDLTISGLSSSFNSTTGRYEGGDTSSASISGMISGIVENVGTDSTRHGFYVFQLDLNNSSWAYDNGHVTSGQLEAFSTSAVPEPTSMALALTVLPIGLIWLRRREERRKAKK